MNAHNHDIWSKKTMFARYLLSTLFLLISFNIWAETTVVATPQLVDPAKLQPIVLQIKKTDGTLDSDLMNQVEAAKVGNQEAKVKKDAQSVTIDPPKLDSGKYSVDLFGKDRGKVIASIQIEYASTESSLTTSDKEEKRRDRLSESNWYFAIVTVMFGALLIPFAGTIVAAARVPQSSFNKPLGLPTGSFRSILAYSLVTYLGFYVLASILSVSKFWPPDFLLGIVATVVGFYFGSRTGDEGEARATAGTVRGTVRQSTNFARGALVKFTRLADGSEPYSRISDINGRFELTGATPGKYKVHAAITGAGQSEGQEISIIEGSDHEIEILIKSTASGTQTPAHTGVVQGTVTKLDGTTAPQAIVVLSQGGVKKFEKSTDTMGKYKVDSVAPGDYDVVATLAQSSSDSRKVTVTPSGQHSLDFKLKQ